MRGFQIGHWTLDNASSNKTFMDKLSILLQSCNIDFNMKDHWIMCFAHIINRCCQHIISDFTNSDLAGAAENFVTALPPGDPNWQTFKEVMGWDPVALGHNIIHVIRNTGQQHEAFNDLVRDGNEKGWFVFRDPPVHTELPLWQLLCDITTRWDSVYYMVQHLWEMHPVHSVKSNIILTDIMNRLSIISYSPKQ